MRSSVRSRRWAAVRLVDFDQLCEAAAWSNDLDQLAEILEVDPDLVSTRIDLLSVEEKEVLGCLSAEDL